MSNASFTSDGTTNNGQCVTHSNINISASPDGCNYHFEGTVSSTDKQTGMMTTYYVTADGGSQEPIYMRTAAVGYLALLMAMVTNADATQNLIANGMMSLSEAISNETQAYSQAWMLVMNNPNGDGKSTIGNPLPASDNPGDNWILWAYGSTGPYAGQTMPSSFYNELSDLGKETWDASSTNTQPHLSVDSSIFNEHNNMYSQATTFFSGISSGLNDSTSNMTNQVSLDYQQIQMNTLAIQQTLVTSL